LRCVQSWGRSGCAFPIPIAASCMWTASVNERSSSRQSWAAFFFASRVQIATKSKRIDKRKLKPKPPLHSPPMRIIFRGCFGPEGCGRSPLSGLPQAGALRPLSHFASPTRRSSQMSGWSSISGFKSDKLLGGRGARRLWGRAGCLPTPVPQNPVGGWMPDRGSRDGFLCRHLRVFPWRG
jgi:hypothetical protein